MNRNKTLVIFILILGIGVVVVLGRRMNKNSASPAEIVGRNEPAPASTKPTVPAYQTAQDAKHLGPTLDPAQFFGKAREAYQVAKRIPQTLAQLPCYCHCDKSFGHKSLHTCFEDDHASHCAVCVDEALLAYQLQQEERLSPEQVREKIVEKYSEGHGHAH